MKIVKNLISIVLLLAWPMMAVAGKGKLLATPGVATIEGAAGGGIVPWAQLAGYATDTQIAASGFCSRAKVSDYALNTCGIQINLYDRVEFSFAKQSFRVEPLNINLGQRIFATKIRLVGDVVYGTMPQISLGVQAKSIDDKWVVDAFGAQDSNGIDIYMSASKVHLASIIGFNSLWNITLRNTDANQIGLLGFGAHGQQRSTQVEASAVLLLSREWAIGVEYRQKPDNLSLKEDDWADVFIAWFPNKAINITAAYLALGEIASIKSQHGWYISIMGNY